MARTTRKQFLEQCRSQIAKHAGPFQDLTDDAAKALDEFLVEQEIQAEDGGKFRTREGWCRSSVFKAEFFKRLALVGDLAKVAARHRMAASAAAGSPTEDLTALSVPDLQAGHFLVAGDGETQGFSISSTCSPKPDPPD